MFESRKEYWKDYISKLSPWELVEYLSSVSRLLQTEEVVESDSVDFFNEFQNLLYEDMFSRYSRMVCNSMALDFSFIS